MKPDICTMAPNVIADDGMVTVLSRCGAKYNLTAEAAMRLSEELVRSAARARGQQRMSEPRADAAGRMR